MGAAEDMGDAPALDDPGQAEIGIVVDDHHRDTREMELLDGAEPHSFQAADDDVAVSPAVCLAISWPGGISVHVGRA